MATYIGVDIGKKSLQLYLPAIDKSFILNNNLSGFTALITQLNKHYTKLTDLILVFEPTGGYEVHLRSFLKEFQINFTTVHPNKVRAFARAKGLFAKTDKLDSKLIYDYATTFSLEAKTCHNTEAQNILHNLLKRREQLINFKNQEINRLETETNELISKSLEKHIDYLTHELTTVNSNIAECSQNPVIKDKIIKLTSIPGVGIILATKVVCELPEIGIIDFRKLTSLVGIAPFARDSGSYNGKRGIYSGRSNLRKVLYMAAVASLRCNKTIKSFYDRLIVNHKPPKVALVAVMRKLLAFMHTLIKNNNHWKYT
ncbi:Transposase IS116/IS110/IS902 family protein [Rickettsiales bacterium Ac37b]|nr:Transposase IS116/IS110/IS902 family protein [Rickettsiales bacterium Ac37b]